MTQPQPADRMAWLRRQVPHLAYGGDYNPEQWPEEVWREDARLMQEAGVNLVSLGVFSWSKLEPRPGVYDFAWLDRVMDLLHEHGIAVNLATPNAAPPAWMAARWPETLPVTEDGRRWVFGARQHFCPSSPVYRAKSAELAGRLAERYRDHPALALWHIGNEYGTYCYCEVSAAHFRRWLAARYGSLEALNEAWGTAFWSQRYGDWEEITPPLLVRFPVNPAQRLDYQRFSSDALLECYLADRDAVLRAAPHVPVTTNFMQFFKPVDYWRWAREVDVVALDSYPRPRTADAAVRAAFNFDLMRSLRGGQPWMLMEQATSAVSQWDLNRTKPPGAMRLGSYQAVARGSDSVMFFQWRASRSGHEKFHSAMVPHGGTDTRVWREVRQLGQELRRLDPVLGSRVRAEVALVLDWSNWWALETGGTPLAAGLRLVDILLAHYAPLWAANVPVDIAHPEGDLGAYRVAVVPNLYLTTRAAAANLRGFVERGGHLVLSGLSGIVDGTDTVWPGGFPGPLRDLAGVYVEETSPLPPGETVKVTWEGGVPGEASVWQDALHPRGAQVLATYAGGELAGVPAATRHRLGAGTATYLGTRPDPASMARLLAATCAAAGVRPAATVPAGVEAVRRTGEAGSFLFLLNHHAAAVTVPLPGPGTDLLDGRRHEGALELPARGVAVLREE